MIKSKLDLKDYLNQDKKMLHKTAQRPKPFSDEIWRFEIVMRKLEYATNCLRGPLGYLYRLWYRFQFHRYSVKLGFSIPINTCGKGLSITHYGTITINEHALIGENCRLQPCTAVGNARGEAAAPQIGKNCCICSGARILGDIRVADRVVIGANAVVTKDILTPDTTWGGIPAKQISSNGSASFFKYADD